MRILFTTHQPFTPQMMGGLQSSADELAKMLRQDGHDVGLLCALMPSGYYGWRGRVINKAIGKRKAAKDYYLGYPTWRAWHPSESLPWVASQFKPDVIIVLARQPVRVALAAQRCKIPVLMMLQDVEFGDHGGSFSDLGYIPCVANSAFTAERYAKAFHVNPVVIPPLINGYAKYHTETSRENVTFINPNPIKGLGIALTLAELNPDIPFSFIETWPLSDEARHELKEKLKSLPNVALLPPTENMKSVYSKCKILLAPSHWEEAYGRVATEAQFSGIPTLGSNKGGLPEAIGPGGISLPPTAPIEVWHNKLRKMWEDSEYYSTLSAAAQGYALRPELTWQNQSALWNQMLQEAINHKPLVPALALE